MAEPDESAFTDLAVDPASVVADMVALRLETQTVTTEFELWPSIEATAETASITDCVIATQHPEGSESSAATVSIRWAAEAIATDDGWRIDAAQQLELFCVAEEMNDQLVTAYQEWLEGQRQWGDPPDPDYPGLVEVMGEPGLGDMRDHLAGDLADNVTMQFPHVPEPVVTDLGMGTARISDCYEAPSEYGAFDLTSGERRTDLVPAPEPDQLNRTVADLERAGDRWLVVGWRWEEQSNCQPGETRYVIP